MKVKNTEIKYYSKLTTNEYHPLFEWSCKKPLRAAILQAISARVRSSDSEILCLEKSEFVLAETETAKFGLKVTQGGKIRRVLQDLIRLGVIQKTGRKTETAQASVYRYIDNDFLDCSRTNRERDRERIENEERGTKSDKSEKNVKEMYTAYKGRINEKSRLTDAARRKIQTRLKTFSSEDLLRAIENFSNDIWWMEHNAHRGVAWFFNSDDRIDGFLTMEPKRDLYRSPDNKVFGSKDEWRNYMESKGWGVSEK